MTALLKVPCSFIVLLFWDKYQPEVLTVKIERSDTLKKELCMILSLLGLYRKTLGRYSPHIRSYTAWLLVKNLKYMYATCTFAGHIK